MRDQENFGGQGNSSDDESNGDDGRFERSRRYQTLQNQSNIFAMQQHILQKQSSFEQQHKDLEKK